MDNPSDIDIQKTRLGTFVKETRVSFNKTINDCAQAMGVSDQTYEEFEQGLKAPSLPEMEALGFYLEIPVDHFLDLEPVSLRVKVNVIENIDQLLPLRHRIIGIMVRKARLDAGITLEELAQKSGIDLEILNDYENEGVPIPLPELDTIAQALNISIRDFCDQNGPIGKWAVQKKAVEDFTELPIEMQQFISKPVNLPYIELAQRLSEMSVDKLRAVAEGLLDITL